MGVSKYLNGYIYHEIHDPGEEGRRVLERHSPNVNITGFKLNGKPAIYFEGKFYVQGNNVLPGSQGIWDRVRKLMGG